MQNKYPKTSRTQRVDGFTLIEIMVVVIVLAILAVTIIPQFAGTTHDARVSRARHDIALLEGALERFQLAMDRYPTTSEGLGVLLTPPADGGTRWRQTLSKMVDDPWGQPYQYRSPGIQGNPAFDLWSRGADGADGGEGEAADITNWDGSQ